MNISEHGLEFIAGWEGLRNRLYDDGGPGRGNATIGVGHLVHLGPIDGRAEEAPYAHGLTDDECYALLREDAQRFVDHVNAVITVPLNQNQFDALVCFAFNLGSLLGVAAVVNAGGDVCSELVKYIKPDWASAGLLRRRRAECALFNEPAKEEEEVMKIGPWWTNRKLAPGQGEINLGVDFGPAAAYELCIVLNSGQIAFQHGDFKPAVEVAGKAATFVLVPGPFGTAPFVVTGGVDIAYLACNGVIKS